MKLRTLQFALLVTSAIALSGFARITYAKTTVNACSATITTCGCTITKAGSYAIPSGHAALTMGGVQTPDCIDISAAKVKLRTNGVPINGGGTGVVGINILKSASSANVQLADPSNPTIPTAISNFTNGIELQASGALLNDFDVSGNNGDGLLIKGASNCAVIDFTSNNGNANGVTINGGSGCQIDAFTSSANAGYGVELINAKSETLENFNVDNSSGVGNTLGGIALTSSSSNTLSNFSADNNLATDIVLSNSSKNSLFQFSADGSVGSGIALSGSSSNSIYDFDASDNTVYGLWLQGSSSNSVRFASALGNGKAGIYLGCSPTMPGGLDCPAKAKPSSKNTVTAVQAGDDTSGTVPVPELFGVAVDLGDMQNNLSGITATGDTTDLDDFNANCGTNVWFANAGTILNPPALSCTAP